MSLAEMESELNTLTPPAKLRLMEALWANLSRDSKNLASHRVGIRIRSV